MTRTSLRHSTPSTWRRDSVPALPDSTVSPLPIIAPSLLASDFGSLALEAGRILDSGADWLHIDVMDGHFTQNLAFGLPVIQSLRTHTDAFFDCHLMVEYPERWVEKFASAGASQFTFHMEAASEVTPAALIAQIEKAKMLPSVAIKPFTSMERLEGVLDKVHMVLVMTVEPGWGGQAFIPEALKTVAAIRKRYPGLNIQVDGGINLDTLVAAAQAGANVIVAGTALFKLPSHAAKVETIRKMKEIVSQNMK